MDLERHLDHNFYRFGEYDEIYATLTAIIAQ